MRDFGLPLRPWESSAAGAGVLRLFEFNFSASETEKSADIIFGEWAVMGPMTGLTKSSYSH